MRKLIIWIILWATFVIPINAQNEVLYKEIHIVFYELGNIPCSRGIRYENGRYYYLRCEYGSETQKKKIGRTEIDVTTNLEVVNLIKKMMINDLEWLSGVSSFHLKKYKCAETKKEFSITLKEKGKNKTIRYTLPLVSNCQGKSPFDFVAKLNMIFNKLVKEFP
ncbi:MAG: hypothetical protein MUE81_03865 [Thermoflexibacter sp.]|jgi:hypothetical protein|nr:hypothetical protein [Thermoflexibacter sp.]